MRLASFTLFLLAFVVLSLLDGVGANLVAALFSAAGAVVAIARQPVEPRAPEPEEPSVSVRVVRWNY
jgi:hypothetical protein